MTREAPAVMQTFTAWIEIVVAGVEAFGVVIIVVGCVVATYRYLSRLLRTPEVAVYTEYRRSVGRAIILGLEFLIAGDVIRTVTVSHTLSDVAVLGLLVLVRAFLSFTLALEIEGRWPWQPARSPAAR